MSIIQGSDLLLKARLLELESELLAKEEANRLSELALSGPLPGQCSFLVEELERELAPALASVVPSEWKGFVNYRRRLGELLICRGRAFKESGLFAKTRAGLDVPYGLDTITEYLRKFDVTPPQDLDHLLVNFGRGQDANVRVFLWYGENLSAYRLIFEADMDSDPQTALKQAISEALGWIMRRPKEQTLPEFLKTIGGG